MRDAVQEALHRIRMGNVAGFDSNETGSFRFDVDHDAQDRPSVEK